MSKPSPAAAPKRARPAFTPVRTRARHDGWTPDCQVAFIKALAECGCVDEACRRVGKGPSSAYALKRRHDARSFREAWEHALDHAISRLSDAVFSRALHGVSHPVFHKGEQIGERRRYDERLAMFLLRHRDPLRYGAWRDRTEFRQEPDGPAFRLAHSLIKVLVNAELAELGEPPRKFAPVAPFRHVSADELADQEEAAVQARARAAERADFARLDAEYEATGFHDKSSDEQIAWLKERVEAEKKADVSCTSSTSAAAAGRNTADHAAVDAR